MGYNIRSRCRDYNYASIEFFTSKNDSLKYKFNKENPNLHRLDYPNTDVVLKQIFPIRRIFIYKISGKFTSAILDRDIDKLSLSINTKTHNPNSIRYKGRYNNG